MKYYFLPHALKRMAERGIPRKSVVKALKFPTKISSNRRGRQLVKKLYNSGISAQRLLLIVIETGKNATKIITVIDTSKISKYLHEKEK